MNPSDDRSPLELAEKHYAAGRFEHAEAVVRRALRRSGGPVEAVQLLAKILIESGKAPQAVYELERALSSRPGDVGLRMMLHNAHVGCGQVDRALAIAESVHAEGPSADAACAIASLHASKGRISEAERWYRTALGCEEGHLRAELGLIRVLSASLRGEEALERLRSRLAQSPGSSVLARMLAFQMQYVSGAAPNEVFEAQKTAGRLAARDADGRPPRLTVTADPDRRIVVGLLSPDFHQHACAHFIEPILAERDRVGFRVIAYSGVTQPDAVTRRFRSMVDDWRDVAMLTDAALAAKIAEDKVDIAVDLAGHTGASRMSCLALRPAPITANYLGYPNTTGTPGIDYRLVDSLTDPPGSEAFATERLVRIDPCFLCFRPLGESPEPSPSPFQASGRITFGSFNVLDKVSGATRDAWGAVLRAVPDSRLLVKARSLADDSVRERFFGSMAGRGIARDRIELVSWAESLRDHLALYRGIDIGLDTFPYNGTTTTCEAMWMGVPVVTVRGSMHAGRVGASLLSAVGLSELIASSADEYARVASSLASDRTRLSALRSQMRSRMAASPLRDERSFCRRFEGALRELWRTWCAMQR